MLVKILGGIDIVAAFCLFFNISSILSFSILTILGIILIIKSFIGFLGDIGSWIDLLCGIVIILSTLLTLPLFIGIILGVAILQKGLMSFL